MDLARNTIYDSIQPIRGEGTVVALRKAILVIGVAVLVGVPSALAAAGPVLSGYGGQAGEAQGNLGGAQGGVASLPFTGGELTLFVLFGAALLVTGFALRRFSGSRG
jgi:hypothetical protein